MRFFDCRKSNNVWFDSRFAGWIGFAGHKGQKYQLSLFEAGSVY